MPSDSLLARSLPLAMCPHHSRVHTSPTACFARSRSHLPLAKQLLASFRNAYNLHICILRDTCDMRQSVSPTTNTFSQARPPAVHQL